MALSLGEQRSRLQAVNLGLEEALKHLAIARSIATEVAGDAAALAADHATLATAINSALADLANAGGKMCALRMGTDKTASVIAARDSINASM